MGLGRIFIFSVFAGFSFGFAYKIGGTNPEMGLGFTFLNLISSYTDSSIQVLLMLISSLFAIFFIFKLATFFRQVYEHKLVGIITAMLGFFGALFVILVQQNNIPLFGLGVGLWIIGLTIIILHQKRNQIKQV